MTAFSPTVPWKTSTNKISTYPKHEHDVGVKDAPALYTSIAHWKPVSPEQFVGLLHDYSVDDSNLDDHMHGLMSSSSFRIDRQTFGTIWYAKKRPGSPVGSPVLLTIKNGQIGKLLHFASTEYGVLASE